MHSAVYGTRTKVYHRYPDLSDKQTGWLELSTPLRSISRPRWTDTRRSNTLDNTDVMEIGRSLATEEDGGPFGIRVTLACLQQAGKLPRRPRRRNTALHYIKCRKILNQFISSIRSEIYFSVSKCTFYDLSIDVELEWTEDFRVLLSVTHQAARIVNDEFRVLLSVTHQAARIVTAWGLKVLLSVTHQAARIVTENFMVLLSVIHHAARSIAQLEVSCYLIGALWYLSV